MKLRTDQRSLILCYLYIYSLSIMKNIIRLLVLFAIILIRPVSAQYAYANLFPLGKQLPSSSVRCMFQDRDGIMWLGTSDGLCRYDGYRLHVYRSSAKSPDLLSNNDIRCITEDGKGRLLIGTWKGINILDPNTNRISSLNFPELNTEIRSIVIDKKGYIWIGTYERLVRCSPDWKECKTYDLYLPKTSVNSIFMDNKGEIWSLFWQQGLYRYNSQKDKWDAMPKIGDDNNPFKMFQDKKGQLWITSWDDGIYMMHPEKPSQMYTPVSADNANEKSRFAAIFGIQQDDKYGYYWMVGHQGLTVVDYKNGKFSIIDMNNVTSKMNNIFSTIQKDTEGNMWIAAFNEGAYIINLNNPVIKNYPFPMIKSQTGGLTTDIKAIYEDGDGDLWIGQNRWGLGIYSHKDNTLRFFNEFPSLKNLKGITSIVYINKFSSEPDVVWVCSEYSSLIYVIKKVNNNLLLDRTYDLEKIGGGYIQQIFEDNRKILWITTSTGIFYKPYGEDIQKIDINIKDASGITMDKQGDIWISTRIQGIFKFTPVKIGGSLKAENLVNLSKENSTLLSNDIECISADNSKTNIWIGSKEGNIFIVNSHNLLINNISSEFYGYINEGIQNIVVDSKNHVWISTNKCIIEYDPLNKGKIAYTPEDDIIVNSLSVNSYYYSEGKYIYYGGNRGITRLTNNISRLSEKAKKTEVLITDVNINNNSILDALLPDSYSLDKEKRVLRLGNEAKNVRIDFSALNYSYPHKVLYAYRIKGIDDDWIYTNGERQFAFYNKLPKGSYTLELRATDINGLWSDTISSYSIIKAPMWYETWWAYLLYTFIIIAILYIIYIKTQKQMMLKNELRITQIEKEKSEELIQAKLSYFTNISHDFLTPITIISCLIDDIEILYLNKIPQLNKMRYNLNKLKRLIQQILDFRKLESGKLDLKVSSGDISTFIRELCETNFEPLMNKKHINFSFITDEDSIPAFFDADKIEKVIFNLLSNAYKYTDEGGLITVNLKLQKKEGSQYIIIRISDTGIGIDPNNLKLIFNRFFSHKGKKGVEGNGIGLALTKELLQLHHATIDVESEINKGSTFSICLPIDRNCYSDTEVDSSKQLPILENTYNHLIEEASFSLTESTNEQLKVDDNKLLIVEDNEELLTLMSQIFSRYRRVITASNGSEAMSIIQNNDIDIIVSDVMMPEMDGLTLCQTLKSDIKTSHIPIILLTAKNNPDDRIACYNAGADGYIAKPFELKVLEARIQNFLSNKQIKQQEFKLDSNIDTDKLETSPIDQQFLSQAISIIQDRILDTEFEINDLAQDLCMSKSSLYRKIKATTGLSPIEFIRNIRLKHACQMLGDSSITISEVAYACGFSNPRYFSSCFKEEFGTTPKAFQKSRNNK